jgi:phage tail tape-measure protein
MAKTIDELVVKIKADMSDLQRELKQIDGKIRVSTAAGGAAFAGLGAAVTKIKGPLIGVAAGVVAVGAGVGVIARVGSGFEDLKDSLDTVFGSIKAGDEAMNRVFEFAQTTPFQIEDATKAFIALKSAGIEPSMDMLQTFADTASVSVDQLGTFEALVRMVQRSASGGMGLEELNMISDRGIDVLGILSDKLNLGKDDIAEFGKTAEGAAEMVQALIAGLNEKFGGAMESKMDNLSTKTSNMVIAFKQLGDELFKSGLGDFLKNMADRLTQLANAITKAVRAAGGRATVADVTGESDTKAQQKKLEILIAGQEAKLRKARAAIAAGFGGQVLADEREALAMIEKLELMLAQVNESIAASATKVVKDGVAPEMVEFLATFKKLADDAKDPIEEINNQLTLLEQIAEDPKLLEYFGTTNEELAEIEKNLIAMRDETEEVAETLGTVLQQSISNAAHAFTNDFVNALMEGESALESFKDFAKKITSQIISTFLQLMVVNKILNAIFGAGTFTTASFTGDGIQVTPANNAGGGHYSQGRAMLVGERGPELMIPNTSGRIMNNMNTRAALSGGGGVTVVQNNNFALGVGATARAEVQKLLPQIAETSKMAVFEAAARGGAYRKGLLGGT